MSQRSEFEVCGVVHLVRPIGRTATDLASLRRGILEVESASLFFHAVQPPLRAPASSDLPPDDFSAWVSGVLQDFETAERLSFAAQRSNAGTDVLRAELAQVLERPGRGVGTAPAESAFAFRAADSVPVPMFTAADLPQLFDGLGRAEASAWFYHLVEEPWCQGGELPLAEFVRNAGAPKLATRLAELSQTGLPLETMRREAMRTWRRSQLGGRVARAATTPEAERADDARDAVARLARRLVRGRGVS